MTYFPPLRLEVSGVYVSTLVTMNYPLINTNIPAGAPLGSYEVVAAFFDPTKPIHGRPDVFLDVNSKFTVR